MKLFDSHCHLDDSVYDSDMDAVLTRARDNGVLAMMIAGVNLASVKKALALAGKHTSVYAAVGLHPHDAKSGTVKNLGQLYDLAADPNVRAWGEIGLDFNRMFSPIEDQERRFLQQLEMADNLKLPVIFHERDSRGRLLELLRSHSRANRTGVVHCFSGSLGEMEQYLDLGYHIGITGILTILQRGKRLRELVCGIPQDRILIETDAPYLTPAPQKNKTRRNEPAFVKSVLLKLAEVRDEDPDVLAEKVYLNTCRLYRVDP